MKACVIFDSRYGNTQRIAESLVAGLVEAGVECSCVNAKDVAVDSLRQFDLVCVGAPTEWVSASKHMKEFIGRLEGLDLSGRYGFAFDTNLGQPLSGSAAKYIEKRLKRLGLQIIAPHESAKVFREKGVANATTKKGEAERFQSIGKRIGILLSDSTAGTPAAGRMERPGGQRAAS